LGFKFPIDLANLPFSKNNGIHIQKLLPVPKREAGVAALDGFDLAAASVFASAQDLAPATDERPQSVARHVFVDRGDWEYTVVHWWLVTT
jgi:hypothetical protein